MPSIIPKEFLKYLEDLTATNGICDALGTTLTKASNLFVGREPPNVSPCITVLSYGGAPPTPEGDRQYSNVQIRIKANSIQKALETGQQMINVLHANTSVCASCNGRVRAVQSQPIVYLVEEGGEEQIVVTNFEVVHTKIT